MRKRTGLWKTNAAWRQQALEKLRLHWPLLVLVLLALPLVIYGVSYEPYWQDELSSYNAAQGVLAHGLPFFPSGFLYEKAELYSYLLAGWQMLLGTAASRLTSVVSYLVSLPLLYYAGCYLFDRRCAFLATTMLAFSPTALLWSRQVRMYELAQVLFLLTVVLLCRALERPSCIRSIYLAMGSLLAMYLCHEETFIALPGFLLAVWICSARAGYFWPGICNQRHWWYAALLAGGVILLQLWLTRVTHPPVLGTDSSQRPMVQLSTDNVPYYLHLLLFPFSGKYITLPDITINTLLALGGCWVALWRGSMRARFCALCWICSLITLMVLFTMKADRYLYPLAPLYYLLGAGLLLKLFSALWHFFCTCTLFSANHRFPVTNKTGKTLLYVGAMLALVNSVLCVLLLPMQPLSGYNLLVSRVLGLAYHHRYPDYDAAGRYVRAHWQAGDVLVCVAPDLSVAYYTGHADYFLSLDRALFLFERDGHIIDTSIGAQALLRESDLLTVLSEHERIWIVSDNGIYQSQSGRRFTFPDDVHLVYEGYGSAVYLRGG